MNTITKILNDTLKSPNGKYSRKSLTMLSSWIMAVLVGGYIVVSDYFLKERIINPYAENVFFGFLLLAGGTSAMTIYDKIKNGGNTNPPTKEETDA